MNELVTVNASIVRNRRYTDEERENAVAVAAAKGLREAARRTGIPRSTIQTWTDTPAWIEPPTPLSEVSDTFQSDRNDRNFGHPELLDRIDDKIDLLIEAITPSRIATASLADVTKSLSALIDKREKLLNATAVTPEELQQRQQLIAEIIAQNVRDPNERQAIAAEFQRLGERNRHPRPPHEAQDPTLRPVDTDQGRR